MNEKILSAKALLSFSFIYEQIRNPTDPRYDTFFASILKNHDLDFAGDIRIVSWNYDYQFEKAYSLYSGSPSLIKNQEKLRVVPGHPRLPVHAEKFSIFKINGTTSFYDSNTPELLHPLDDLSIGANKRVSPIPVDKRRFPVDVSEETQADLAKTFTDYYYKSINGTYLPMLSFAWENISDTSMSTQVLNTCINSIGQTKALVVIGYSFPFFNREIDKKIIAHLGVEYPIYIQDPNFFEVESNLKSVIQKGHNNPIIRVSNLNQFYLPAEF